MIYVVQARAAPDAADARPRHPVRVGVSQGQMQPQRFTVSFYLTAMLFIVFDIEIVFLYPLAVQLHALGWFGFVELAFFVLILPSRTSSSGARAPSSGRRLRRADHAPARLRPAVGAAALADEGALPVRGGARRRGARARARADDAGEGRALGADEVDVAGHVRPRVLRDRDDVDRLLALRPRALRDGGVPLVAAPGRPAHRLGPRRAQDGRAAAPDLRPDARAEVGHRDGRLRELRRDVQQLHRSSRASTASSPSTSTSPSARRGRRR